jgi:hypothetical protein
MCSLSASSHAGLNVFYTFDEADPVKVVDHSVSGLYTSYAGQLPDGKDLLTYSSFRSPTRPTFPRLVASRAPIVGMILAPSSTVLVNCMSMYETDETTGSGLSVKSVSTSVNTTLTLTAVDDDTASLIFKLTSYVATNL